MKGGKEGRRGKEGFALLLVIWTLTLAAGLAVVMLGETRSGAVIARNRIERARAETLAQSGINLAILHLIAADPAGRWGAGTRHDLALSGGHVALAIDDEDGKLDLNAAPMELFDGLAGALDLDAQDRTAFLAGIATRRQSARDGGALALPDIVALSRRPFRDISELRLIAGLSKAAYERISPYVTVWSGGMTINPMTALPPVLLALPNVGPKEVETYLDGRKSGALTLPGGGRYVAPVPLHTVTITADAVTDGRARFIRQAVVRITADLPFMPYRILAWRQP